MCSAHFVLSYCGNPPCGLTAVHYLMCTLNSSQFTVPPKLYLEQFSPVELEQSVKRAVNWCIHNHLFSATRAKFDHDKFLSKASSLYEMIKVQQSQALAYWFHWLISVYQSYNFFINQSNIS